MTTDKKWECVCNERKNKVALIAGGFFSTLKVFFYGAK